MTRNLFATLILATALTACGGQPEAVAEADAAIQSSKGMIASAMDKAKRELTEGNLKLDQVLDGKRAEITPDGDFLIAGERVEITEAQRKLLLVYREELLAVATAGMDLGAQGAELGTRAALEAVKSVFGGDREGLEKRIEAEAEVMRIAAAALCDRLPTLRKAQDELAAALPAFKPYAKMRDKDISECQPGGLRNRQTKEIRIEV